MPMTRVSKPSIGAGLPLVERLALGHALDDVDHHHGAGEVLLGETLRRGGAYVACAHDGHFFEHARSLRGRVEKAGRCSPKSPEF